MATDDRQHRDRLEKFQADLTRPSEEIVQKHILTGAPVALSEDEYFELRDEVARHFAIHPVEVVLVGSCRVGFTLWEKPKKKRPRYSPVGPGSDIDLAVVSSPLFARLWDAVFDYARDDPQFLRTHAGETLRRTLFQGWVDIRGLPKSRRLGWVSDWIRFFDQMKSDRRFGSRKTSARVYLDWKRLAAYQQIAVDSCKQAARGQIS
jgi:hypothetical protein